jgi:hypothetical protein
VVGSTSIQAELGQPLLLSGSFDQVTAQERPGDLEGYLAGSKPFYKRWERLHKESKSTPANASESTQPMQPTPANAMAPSGARVPSHVSDDSDEPSEHNIEVPKTPAMYLTIL